jgi:hypothetical protein
VPAAKNNQLGIGRLGMRCGFAPDAARAAAIDGFVHRLRLLTEFTRKLLAHIVDLAYRQHHDGREPGVAYLPEVHETCGIGVDELYAILQQLETAGFIRLEGKYPFQAVVPVDLVLEDHSPWNVMRDLAAFCKSERISLGDLIVGLHFEELA